MLVIVAWILVEVDCMSEEEWKWEDDDDDYEDED